MTVDEWPVRVRGESCCRRGDQVCPCLIDRGSQFVERFQFRCTFFGEYLSVALVGSGVPVATKRCVEATASLDELATKAKGERSEGK